MPALILMRHGQSTYNAAGRLTGWADPPLTSLGRDQALAAGHAMAQAGLRPAAAYASWLRRALATLWLALEGLDMMWLPQAAHWRLNERHCGAWQGLRKNDLPPERLALWPAWDFRPPALSSDDPRHPCHAPRYTALGQALPATESRADALARLQPLWEAELASRLRSGDDLLITAHGGLLQALASRLIDGGAALADWSPAPARPLVLELTPGLGLAGWRELGDGRPL